MNNLVAVYGSLLTGLGNHRIMALARGDLIGRGKSVDNYDMFSMGAFPSVSLAHSEHGTPLVVEVYSVDKRGLTGPLDALEGYPRFYNRTQIPVQLENGEVVDAWIYHIDEKREVPVPNGDWRMFYNEGF